MTDHSGIGTMRYIIAKVCDPVLRGPHAVVRRMDRNPSIFDCDRSCCHNYKLFSVRTIFSITAPGKRISLLSASSSYKATFLPTVLASYPRPPSWPLHRRKSASGNPAAAQRPADSLERYAVRERDFRGVGMPGNMERQPPVNAALSDEHPTIYTSPAETLRRGSWRTDRNGPCPLPCSCLCTCRNFIESPEIA